MTTTIQNQLMAAYRDCTDNYESISEYSISNGLTDDDAFTIVIMGRAYSEQYSDILEYELHKWGKKMNRVDEKSIAEMLGLWALDFNQSEADAVAYLDRVLAISDEQQRERIVGHIRDFIEKQYK